MENLNNNNPEDNLRIIYEHEYKLKEDKNKKVVLKLILLIFLVLLCSSYLIKDISVIIRYFTLFLLSISTIMFIHGFIFNSQVYRFSAILLIFLDILIVFIWGMFF